MKIEKVHCMCSQQEKWRILFLIIPSILKSVAGLAFGFLQIIESVFEMIVNSSLHSPTLVNISWNDSKIHSNRTQRYIIIKSNG